MKKKVQKQKKKARQERRLPLALEWATPPISLPPWPLTSTELGQPWVQR